MNPVADKIGAKRLGGAGGKPPHKPGSYPDPQKLMGKNSTISKPCEEAQKLLEKVKAKQEVCRNNRMHWNRMCQ